MADMARQTEDAIDNRFMPDIRITTDAVLGLDDDVNPSQPRKNIRGTRAKNVRRRTLLSTHARC